MFRSHYFLSCVSDLVEKKVFSGQFLSIALFLFICEKFSASFLLKKNKEPEASSQENEQKQFMRISVKR